MKKLLLCGVAVLGALLAGPVMAQPGAQEAEQLVRRLEEIKRENWRVYNDHEAFVRTHDAWNYIFNKVNTEYERCLIENASLRVPRPSGECQAIWEAKHRAVMGFDWRSPPGKAKAEGVWSDKLLQCWQKPAGAVPVTLMAAVRRGADGVVGPYKAELKAGNDTARYGTDERYRVSVDAAREAIMNPRCWGWPAEYVGMLVPITIAPTR